jgi:hypothetical protein
MTAICVEGSNPLFKLIVKLRTFISTPAEVAQEPTVGKSIPPASMKLLSAHVPFSVHESSGALSHMANPSDRYIPGSSNRYPNIPITALLNTHVNHVPFRCHLNYSCEG